MTNKCVVGGCSNKPDPSKGVGLHRIPFYEDNRPAAKKRRRKWVEFVSTKRKFKAKEKSTICSIHFKAESFERRFANLEGMSKPSYPRLKRDKIGISVYPTLHPGQVDSPKKKQSKRGRRKVLT